MGSVTALADAAPGRNILRRGSDLAKGERLVGYDALLGHKALLTIVESDGCFADGVAATGCTVGHRTLRVEEYGKVAVTLVHVETERAFRIAPALDCRQ